MLDSLRAATQTWIAKLLLGMLVLSFAAWGIADIFREDMSGSAALSAGKSEVSAVEYRFAYEQQMMRLSQQFQQRLTKEQAQALGVESQVLSQLAAGVVLDEEARQMNLGITKDGIARLVAEDPSFHDASGRFSPAQFDAVMRQSNIRAQDYLDSRTQVARRQQIVEAVTDGISVPDTLLKALALYEGESRTVDYITIQPEKAGDIAAPSEDVLKAYFETNKAQYAAPEYRKLTYVKLEPSDIADPSQITPEEISDYYEKNQSRYSTTEKRTIEQLSFTDEAAANAAAEKLKNGMSFDDLAKELNKSADDIKLGTFEKSALPDPVLAEAAFGLTKDQASDVVKGAFGPVILRVTEIDSAHTKPLTEVEQEIRLSLATTIAATAISNVRDQLEEDISNGVPLSEAATKAGLKAVTVDAIDAEGNDMSEKPVENLPVQAQLVSNLFQTHKGIDNDPLSLGTNGFLWYQADDIIAARDRTLDEVKDKLVEAWKADEAIKNLIAKTDDLKKKLQDGTSLDALAEELSITKNTKRGVTRTTNDIELGSAAVAAIFRGANGHIGTAATPNNDAQILFKVTDVVEPAGISAESITEDRRKAAANGFSDDLLTQLIAELQKQYPVKVNQAAINNAMAF
ncbi:peptidyl-prolyl cis-trans isomerase D [Paenochrobactrum gallinarii]|uniref:Parvulin-like PPIase n=1 Tax=Paenochrobactrum gallinarii TaxID=643673 RepID=A0A841LNP8_9HYPH|nr:peptidyl-prolyl cis-trans isomerase [Paenochrobactrum gallinarii]MBB6259615.1 peptidyl-prolyl cis-trans isomerase D [Paenochrobactrum gallinarii]